MRRIVNHTVYNVPDVLQRAAARVLGSSEERAWRDEVRARYVEARALCAARLPAPAHVPEEQHA